MTQPLPGQLGFGPTPFGTDAEEMARRIRDLDQRMSALATSLTLAINTTAGAVYPVGSIYLSVNNTNPASLFGGTWVAWGTGRVPVAVDTGQTEFNTVEKTGGEKAHTLTASEQASMNVGAAAPTGTPNASSPGAITPPAVLVNETVTDNTSGSNRATVASGSAANFASLYASGGGGAHNNLQPYITCYMFKRTA